ncbi:TatD family hydrolase [Desulfurococcus mucosus]|uniref:TatD-related deoxyribonuclease n=1 Tax=Desulfurococcus mucosus (strain ATCC 35584 / DSM 2162 / JCM 9187 / O7/1) TaxID=765177 RepID=E8R7K1_DESM0|nr:TatD family hydrolase [Desulfurococcus mucosus]ADV64496.1 TatD-related deoxyribonuclease [Desulfurococcus mucosus DSM 2162]
MLFSDAHLHTNPVKGMGASRVSERFKREGGWFMALVALPPYHYGIEEVGVDSYRRVLEILNREAQVARSHGLRVARLMGLHPAEIDEYYRRGVKGRKLYELASSVLDLIRSALKAGLLDGIGEVGRQHYATSVERIVLSEMVMMNALEISREYDVVIHLHLEQGGWVTAFSVERLRRLLVPGHGKIVLHHSSSETVLAAEELGLAYTIPVKGFDEKLASRRPVNAMVESDFIDDPERPGAAAYPWEIPRVLKGQLERGVIDEEYVYRIMVENITRYYGVAP